MQNKIRIIDISDKVTAAYPVSNHLHKTFFRRVHKLQSSLRLEALFNREYHKYKEMNIEGTSIHSKGVQTFLSVSFEYAVIKAGKNAPPVQ